jgi:hypothetical protein
MHLKLWSFVSITYQFLKTTAVHLPLYYDATTFHDLCFIGYCIVLQSCTITCYSRLTYACFLLPHGIHVASAPLLCKCRQLWYVLPKPSLINYDLKSPIPITSTYIHDPYMLHICFKPPKALLPSWLLVALQIHTNSFQAK